MKFKVGDKVKHKEYGFGKIIHIDKKAAVIPYAVRFEIFNGKLHGLGMFGAPSVKSGHGWLCKESDLKLVEEAPKNLIPQIAKMLGVEIGEEFMVGGTNYKIDVDKGILVKDYITKKYRELEIQYTDNIYAQLILGKYTIQKLPKKPKLTEAEKIILENLPKEHKWIARDKNGKIYTYTNKPKKIEIVWSDNVDCEGITIFNHLFQFIKWEDEEPYNIEELLKGELKNGFDKRN